MNTPIQNLINYINDCSTIDTINGEHGKYINIEKIDFIKYLKEEELLIKKCCDDSIINWKNGNIKIGIPVGEQYFLENFAK